MPDNRRRLSLLRAVPLEVGKTGSSRPLCALRALCASSSRCSAGTIGISRRPAWVFERPMEMRRLAKSMSRQSRWQSSVARGAGPC